jgi:hypothetical protein
MESSASLSWRMTNSGMALPISPSLCLDHDAMRAVSNEAARHVVDRFPLSAEIQQVAEPAEQRYGGFEV